jgi:hypothetical protein
MNCHIVHRDGRRTRVPRPCLSDRIELIRWLRQRDVQPERLFADAGELAKFLAEWERGATDSQGVDRVTALQWEPGLLAIVTVGSAEFVDRRLAEQAGFDDAILSAYRTWDGLAACAVIGWTLSPDAVRTLGRELNRTTVDGRAT